jgi:hypothetical protein
MSNNTVLTAEQGIRVARDLAKRTGGSKRTEFRQVAAKVEADVKARQEKIRREEEQARLDRRQHSRANVNAMLRVAQATFGLVEGA